MLGPKRGKCWIKNAWEKKVMPAIVWTAALYNGLRRQQECSGSEFGGGGWSRCQRGWRRQVEGGRGRRRWRRWGGAGVVGGVVAGGGGGGGEV